ncbi:MAG: hypothetical protein QOF06_2100 [Solirubrobacterales bacterium]|jgi:hypothetical protein|nr:hypothetical protein [Solirubrobacterales bacterium]
MDISRSPALIGEARESGHVEIVRRPIGMLPRLPNTVRVKEENRELVLDIAENLFPGTYAISDLKKGEREKWIILSCDILRENKAELSASIEAIAKVLDPAVQAEIEDTLLKRNFFFEQEEKRSEIEEEERDDRKEREKVTHTENLLDRAQARRLADERWALEKRTQEKQLDMEESERRTRLKNTSWRERIGMAMAVIGFSAALALLAIGVMSGDGYVAGSSGAVAATILGVILRLLFLEQRQPPSPPPGDPATSASG